MINNWNDTGEGHAFSFMAMRHVSRQRRRMRLRFTADLSSLVEAIVPM